MKRETLTKYECSDLDLGNLVRAYGGIGSASYRQYLALIGKEKMLDDILANLDRLSTIVPMSKRDSIPENDMYNYIGDLEYKIRELQSKTKIDYGE